MKTNNNKVVKHPIDAELTMVVGEEVKAKVGRATIFFGASKKTFCFSIRFCTAALKAKCSIRHILICLRPQHIS